MTIQLMDVAGGGSDDEEHTWCIVVLHMASWFMITFL